MSNSKKADFKIGYFNSIGNGWGEIDKSNISIHRLVNLTNGRLSVDCSNKSQRDKYLRILESTDYFINYQSKIANKIQGIRGMYIDGIFKKKSPEIKIQEWLQNDSNKRYLLSIDVIRVDKGLFKMDVYNNSSSCYKWGDSISPSNWIGTKNVSFRGGVGRIKNENFRHKFIKDFMIKNEIN